MFLGVTQLNIAAHRMGAEALCSSTDGQFSEYWVKHFAPQQKESYWEENAMWKRTGSSPSVWLEFQAANHGLLRY